MFSNPGRVHGRAAEPVLVSCLQNRPYYRTPRLTLQQQHQRQEQTRALMKSSDFQLYVFWIPFGLGFLVSLYFLNHVLKSCASLPTQRLPRFLTDDRAAVKRRHARITKVRQRVVVAAVRGDVWLWRRRCRGGYLLCCCMHAWVLLRLRAAVPLSRHPRFTLDRSTHAGQS